MLAISYVKMYLNNALKQPH